MYLLDRQKKILTLLISYNGWITGEKIGSALGITDRTVRNDIRIINEELQEYTDSIIESIRGKGYFLVSKERNILLEKLEKTNVGETTEGRLYSIALEILMTQVFRKRFDSWNGGKRIYASAGGRCCNHYSYANSL